MMKRIWVVVSDSLKIQSGRNIAVIGITSLDRRNAGNDFVVNWLNYIKHLCAINYAHFKSDLYQTILHVC